MNILITGGAGFIGRHVAELLSKEHDVWILDNMENSSQENIKDFKKNIKDVIIGDITNRELIKKVFKNRFDVCIHAAAKINVHESLEKPEEYFNTNVVATFYLLEEAKRYNTKFILVSTCMVYDTATEKAIGEHHPVKPASAYAATKLAAEELALSYHYAYRLLGTSVFIVSIG